MSLLDRYIIKQLFWNMLLVLGGLISLYLLIDFFEQIDQFTEKGLSIGFALRFFIIKIPGIYYQLSPVAILLAGIITLGLLNHNREAMALNAGGISLWRILSPMIIASLLLTLITLAMSQWLLPITTSKTNKIWYTQVKQPIINGILQNGRIFFRGSEGIYTFRLTKDDHAYRDLIYSQWNDDYTLTNFLVTQNARHKEEWHLGRGLEKTLTPQGTYAIKTFRKRQVALPEGATDFFAPVYRPAEHSITHLWHKAQQDKKEGLLTGTLDFYARLSFILLGVPLFIFAIPLTIHVHQRWGRDLTVAVPLSCCLAFIFWGIWSSLQSMARAEILTPNMAAWSIHIAMLSIGLLSIFRMNRGG